MDEKPKKNQNLAIIVLDEREQEVLDRAKKYTDDKYKHLNALMVGVVIVCFLGFLTLLFDSFSANRVAYREYKQQEEKQLVLEESKEQLQRATNLYEEVLEIQKRLLQKIDSIVSRE